jgi:hypothetical protein
MKILISSLILSIFFVSLVTGAFQWGENFSFKKRWEQNFQKKKINHFEKFHRQTFTRPLKFVFDTTPLEKELNYKVDQKVKDLVFNSLGKARKSIKIFPVKL